MIVGLTTRGTYETLLLVDLEETKGREGYNLFSLTAKLQELLPSPWLDLLHPAVSENACTRGGGDLQFGTKALPVRDLVHEGLDGEGGRALPLPERKLALEGKHNGILLFSSEGTALRGEEPELLGKRS